MPLKGKRALLDRLRERSDQLVRATVLEAHGRQIKKTPRDTGRAANNWNVAVGEPDRSVTDKDRYPQSGAESMQQAAQVIGSVRAGDVIYTTNSLPYIPGLEDGSSTQAPQGMTKVTVAELRPWFLRQVVRIASGE